MNKPLGELHAKIVYEAVNGRRLHSPENIKLGDIVYVDKAPIGGFTIEYLNMTGEVIYVDPDPNCHVPYLVRFYKNGKAENQWFLRNRLLVVDEVGG